STSDTSPDPYTLTSANVSKRGIRPDRGRHINVNESQYEYTPLKVVPNCKFCDAKRFYYELPRFCCNNGSIKLTSHKIPT
ncbi:hypothetical protein H5410_046643, partial [Solanum commersonii]